jgi:hypothetical protein
VKLSEEFAYLTSDGACVADACASLPPPQPLVRAASPMSAAAHMRRLRGGRRASIPLFCIAGRAFPTGPNDQGAPPDRLAVVADALSAKRIGDE